MDFQITTGQTIGWSELAELMNAVGWSDDYNEELFLRSMQAYTLVAQARNQEERLIGYLTVFCDGAFSAAIGEIVVHPNAQGNGVGRALLVAAETAFPDIPIHTNALRKAKYFFERCGYKVPAVEMTYMFKNQR